MIMYNERMVDNNLDAVANICIEEINGGSSPEEVLPKYFVLGKDNFGTSDNLFGVEVAYFKEIIPCARNAFYTHELSQHGFMFEGYWNSLKLLGEEYVKNIFHRQRGSRWNITPRQFFELEWDDFYLKPEVWDGKSFYFRAIIPDDIEAYEEIFLLNDLTDDEVRIVEGKHGIELVTERKPEPKRVKTACAIYSVYEERYVLATAYPGKLTASIKQFPGLSIRELRQLNYRFAVKSI